MCHGRETRRVADRPADQTGRLPGIPVGGLPVHATEGLPPNAWRLSQETVAAIGEIERNAGLAMSRAKRIRVD